MKAAGMQFDENDEEQVMQALMYVMGKKQVSDKLVSKEEALPGREELMPVSDQHYVLRTPMRGPWPADARLRQRLLLGQREGRVEALTLARALLRLTAARPAGLQTLVFANGCFWGSEKGVWRLPGGGIHSTAVGYAGGFTPNPTYEEACSGRTGHTEAVQVIFDPSKISLVDILRWFWEAHDPTQGMGQGNDRGTQYRSALYYFDDEQRQLCEASAAAYQAALKEKGKGKGKEVTTEIRAATDFPEGRVFYYAEDYHQQYLAKPGARPYCSAQPQEVSLPPFPAWAPKELLERHAPKLQEDFWKAHGPKPHCVIHSPNEPIKWP